MASTTNALDERADRGDHRQGRSEVDDTRTALAAYHAGQGNVDGWLRAGEGIGFPETRSYVDEVSRVRDVYAEACPLKLGRQ